MRYSLKIVKHILKLVLYYCLLNREVKLIYVYIDMKRFK